MARPEKIRLGDLLVQQKLISQEQLGAALEKQRQSGRKLGRVLVEHGFVTEDEISGAIARQLHIPFLDLRQLHVRPEIVRLLPEQLARRFRAIVLEQRENKVLVAMADPTDLFAFDEIINHLNREVELAVANEGALLQFIDRVYRRTEEISELARNLTDDIGEDVIDFGALAATQSAEEAPVVRLLQTIFEDAMQVRASDIHVEPQERGLQIRFRVDGVLSIATEADRKIAPALVQRLKLMADLDIAEKRLPQDGRFMLRLKQRSIDVRMSTVPTQFGESAVLRLLTGGGSSGLADLAMTASHFERFTKLIHRPHGLILVTGPTGSGKTTTLYAALADLNTPERKILTVEDPVEYRLPGINQIQVNDKIDLTFARALRAFLRQDPDIILLGEMRDAETAQIALRAALTGHLVLSTLHTNDAPSAITRLIDLGVPPYLLSATIIGVMAQRLVRTLCPHCKQPSGLRADDEQAWNALVSPWKSNMPTQLYRPVGCLECRMTGYAGRIGIYEIMPMTQEMKKLVAARAELSKLREQATRDGMKPLRIAGARKVAAGVTTIQEIIKAAPPMLD
jgi:MSHA biogenesis protein MshE